MGILSLISNNNFITLNKTLIKALGIEEAIMLGELASEYDYWEKQGKIEDGWFYSTVENIEENTTLNDYKQRIVLKNLKDMGMVDTKLCGVPAKRFVKINEESIANALNLQFFKISRTRSQKIKELDLKNLKINNNIINKNINNKNNNNINKANIYKKEIHKEKSLSLDFENEFEEVWRVYPKKIGKVNAMKSFIKARTKGTTLEEIKTGLNNYLKYIKVEKVKTQFIKNGSTWFYQECWNDDYSIKRELTTGDIAEFMDFSSFRED